jgi:hypothetical protein
MTMARANTAAPARPRISIDVDPEFRRRLRIAAAERDITIRQYVLEAIEQRLRRDAGDEDETSDLTSGIGSVLAELWDNPIDAQYDRL